MKKILVTGNTGLIGSVLVRYLSRLPNVEVRLFRTPERVRDIYNPRDVAEAVEVVDVVFHLAGVLNYRLPSLEALQRVNVVGTANLLNAGVAAGVKSFVIGSTQGVYANSDGRPGPFSEDTPLRPKDSYARSKLESESICRTNAAWKCSNILLLRIATVYGQQSMSRDDVLTAYVRQALQSKKIIVYGSGKRVRDMVYVGDVAQAMIELVGHRGVYNIGGGYPYTSAEIAQNVVELVGGRIEFEASKPEVPGFYMDISRLQAAIDYRPLCLRKGLELTLADWGKEVV
jgi:nucleoside-diphosphate-sugar epimerase